MTHEPRDPSQVVAPGNLPVEWGSNPLDPHEFLAFVEAHVTPEMLINDRPGQAKLALVLDGRFYSGSRMTQTFNVYTGERAVKDNEADFGLIPNPAPTIELRHTSDAGGWQASSYAHKAFRLKEEAGEEHYYFFSAGNPAEEVPPYLRPSDVVPSRTYRQTLPPEARERAKEELEVDDETLEWLRYDCDPVLAQYLVLVDIPFNKPLERVPVGGGAAERFNYVKAQWEPSGGNYDPGFRARMASHLRKILKPRLPALTRRELPAGE